MQYSFKLVPVTIRDVSLQQVALQLVLSICCLLPAMYAISICCIKITTFQTLKKKQNKLELTDMIDFGDFSTLCLVSPSVISIKYVLFL